MRQKIYCIALILLISFVFINAEDYSIKVKAPTSISAKYIYLNGERKVSIAIAQMQSRIIRWLYDGRYYTIETLTPTSVGIDEKGNLWIGDAALNAMIKIYLQGSKLSFTCYQNNSLIDNPVDIDFIWGNTIIADNLKGQVLVLDQRMNPHILVSGLINPTAIFIKPRLNSITKLKMNNNLDIADLYVSHLNSAGYSDTNHPVIRKYITNLITATLEREYSKYYIEFPVSAAVIDDFTLMVLDGHLASLRYFDLSTGDLIKREGTYGPEPFGWRNPSDVAIINKCALIADAGNDRIIFHSLASGNEGCLPIFSLLGGHIVEMGNLSSSDFYLRVINCQEK